ncbi:MAG: nucleotidyl transferase AbiEii/AbiGii toxin family protein [Bacteroidia bacterium]|nr:nucleotidyl transferase AbiEii/AbiGii toxin family protein [Bacteroidia bacterium]
MLSLREIKPYYPAELQVFERFIYREYLQFKILELIFESPFAGKLSFLGGTCLRIVHGNNRFSEDLDFDNFDLTAGDFDEITEIIRSGLERLGYKVEMRNVHKGAWHCFIRFPELLYHEGMTGHKEEKILIQLDTEPHGFPFQPDQPLLNKFDVFTMINATPKDLLLAQKFYAVLNRKRAKGRDFFDLVFLLGQGQIPNYAYLEFKTGIRNPDELRERILAKCAQLDMQEMAAEVRPFLFDPKDEKRILLFPQYLAQVNLG